MLSLLRLLVPATLADELKLFCCAIFWMAGGNAALAGRDRSLAWMTVIVSKPVAFEVEEGVGVAEADRAGVGAGTEAAASFSVGASA